MEERTRKTGYAVLLALSGLFAAAAAATLIPNPGASWPNILGYRSLCTFAPIATAVCALLAGATCTLRARLFGASSGRGRLAARSSRAIGAPQALRVSEAAGVDRGHRGGSHFFLDRAAKRYTIDN